MKHISLFKSFSKKMILISWIVSYLLVFILSFACNLLTYRQCKKNLLEQIKSTDKRSVQIAATKVDGLMSSLRSVASTVNASLSLAAFNESASIETLRSYKASVLSSFLKEQIKSIPQVDMIFCYFKDLDYVVSSGSILPAADFYDAYCGGTFESQSSWIEALDKFSYFSYYTSGGSRDEENGFIHIYYTLPLKQVNESSVTLGFYLSKNKLYELVNQFLPLNERNFYIIDKKNNKILEKQILKKDIPLYESAEYLEDTAEVSACFCESSLNSWIYVVETPTEIISKRMNIIMLYIIIILAAEIVLGIFLIMFFVKNNYKKLMSVVRPAEKFLDDRNNVGNEYEILSAVMQNYRNDKKRYHSIAQANYTRERAQFLAGILRGELYPNLLERADEYDISFDKKYFYVIMISANESDEYIETYKNSESGKHENGNITVFIISNVVEELFASSAAAYTTVIDGFIYISVNTDCEIIDFKDKIIESLRHAEDFIVQNFKLSFSAIISSCHMGVAGISEAYSEIIDAKKHYDLLDVDGNTGIIFADEIRSPVTQTEKFKNRVEQIFDFIEAGKGKIALDVFESTIDEVRKNNNISVVHMFILDFCSKSIKTLLKIKNEHESEELTEMLKKISKISFTNNMNLSLTEAMEEILNKEATMFENASAEQRKASETETDGSVDFSMVSNIRRFVNKHFCDADLYLSTIGEYLGKTPYYLSSCFKSAEGISLTSYISLLRTEAAKEIMKNCDDSIETIALSLGFGNTRNFNRAFKKNEGISPSQYKQKFK